MKRILTMLLALAMMFTLFACGKKPADDKTRNETPTGATAENSVTEMTDVPTEAPTEETAEIPTEEPTEAPETKATKVTTTKATKVPTSKATAAPTTKATNAPTTKATAAPTTKATAAPTAAPTTKATAAPTVAPTAKPTAAPTTKMTVPKDPLEDLDWFAQFAYVDFSAYYSPEEYVNFISKLKAALNETRLNPVYPINEKLLFAYRVVDTYDKYEESCAIVDVDGNLITDWNANWSASDISNDAKCGDYFFITTGKGDYYGNTSICDVINKEGELISTVHCGQYRYDIGSGYIFFSRGRDNGYIMNDKGEVIELQYKSVIPGYGELPGAYLSEDDELGKISEDLFYIYSKGNNNTVAYYYNTQGEVLIDLSTQAVNYRVTKMSDFVNGQARIEFVGANYKDYYVYIDKTGAFIGEPVEM